MATPALDVVTILDTKKRNAALLILIALIPVVLSLLLVACDTPGVSGNGSNNGANNNNNNQSNSCNGVNNCNTTIHTCTIEVADGLNIRAEPNSHSTLIGHYPSGTILHSVQVVNGESVNGDSLWGQTSPGHYIWLGGTDHPNG